MAVLRCPGCGKPATSRSRTCRWCGFEIREKTDAGSAPIFDAVAELKEMAGWKGASDPIPPLLPLPLTVVLCVMGAIQVAITIYFYRQEFGGMALRMSFFCGLLLGGLGLAMAWQPLKLRTARYRRTPEEAAEYYYGQVRQKRFDFALKALAGYLSAGQRHASLPQQWSYMNPGGLATLATIDQVIVSEAAPLGDDAAVVRVQLEFAQTTGFTVPGLFHYSETSSRMFEALKLLIRRGERWYLVNGLPPDVLDQQLIAALQAGGKSAD